MSTQEPWSEERTRAIVANHAHLEGPMMPILHAVQEAFGFVPEAGGAGDRRDVEPQPRRSARRRYFLP